MTTNEQKIHDALKAEGWDFRGELVKKVEFGTCELEVHIGLIEGRLDEDVVQINVSIYVDELTDELASIAQFECQQSTIVPTYLIVDSVHGEVFTSWIDGVVTQALAKYVAGDTTSITPAERTIIEDALRHAGLPPEPVNQLVVTPPSTSPGGTTTPSTGLLRTTYVMAGETPDKIAVRLRHGGYKAANGSDLTAAYLIRLNQWRTAHNAPRWPGEKVWF